MIDQTPKLLMHTGSGSQYTKPIFISNPLGFSNHINGLTNLTGLSYLQIVGSAGLFRCYRDNNTQYTVYNPNTQDLYSACSYEGSVFGAGFYGSATGAGGTFLKSSGTNTPGYNATVQRSSITGNTSYIMRTVQTIDQQSVVFGGPGRISTGENLMSTSPTNNWVSRNSNTTQTLNYGAYGRFIYDSAAALMYGQNQKFIIVGTNGTYVVSSTDGSVGSWTASRFRASTATMNGIAIADNIIVAVGNNGTIYTCDTSSFIGTGSNNQTDITDPNVWVQCASPVSVNLRAVCSPFVTPHNAGYETASQYNNKRKFWIIVGDNGTILSSTDGFNWVQCDSPTTAQLNCVTASGFFGSYVVGGQNGTFLVGYDGT